MNIESKELPYGYGDMRVMAMPENKVLKTCTTFAVHQLVEAEVRLDKFQKDLNGDAFKIISIKGMDADGNGFEASFFCKEDVKITIA